MFEKAVSDLHVTKKKNKNTENMVFSSELKSKKGGKESACVEF